MDYQKSSVAFHVVGNNISVSSHGERGTIRKGAPEYDLALKAIRENDMDRLQSLALPSFDISKYSHLEIYVHEGKLYRLGKEVESRLSAVVLNLKKLDLPYEYLLKFWDRLNKNPEPSSVKQLYDFIEHNGIHITSDGLIMGYKSVKSDMTDHHTGRISHALYSTPKMDRADVECNPATGCGKGLHFGSYKFAKSFSHSGVLIEVLVDPMNVVSVPRDADYQKCRTCELFVSAICDGENKGVIYDTPKEAKKELKKEKKGKGKKEKKGKKVVTKTSTTNKPPKKGTTLIGRYYYNRKPIDSKMVDDLVDLKKKNPYMRITKSDFPKFFLNLSVTEMYRQRNGKSSNYIAGVKGAFIQYIVS